MGRQVARAAALRCFFYGSSLAAVSAGLCAPAFAQCAPDPTRPNETTVCGGVDTNGIVVNTNNSTVRVDAGATVSATVRPAILIDVPFLQPTFRTATVNVIGNVLGGTQAGIGVFSGTPQSSMIFGGGDFRLALTVARDASVTGQNGVLTGPSSGNAFGRAVTVIDNAGTITGTSGIALASQSSNLAYFEAITNRSTGFIGAITSMVLRLDNAGTIDGGANSAINLLQPQGSSQFFPSVINSGTIRSANAVSTLVSPPSNYQITNSGTLLNTGSGNVVNAQSLQITNAAGGVISSSSTAIVARDALTLINNGTVTGNIIVNAGHSVSFASTIDSRGGLIQGNVTFGGTNDVLVARYSGNSTFTTGISGTINGGAGTDTLEVVFGGNQTVANRFTLPTGFERLAFTAETGATVTLAPTYSEASTLVVGGGGTLVNRGTLTGTAQALVSGNSVASLAIINEGTIRTTTAVANQFGIQLSFVRSFTNTGTISLAGDGISMSQGVFDNSGTITAAGNAVRLFGSRFSNSGTIRSTGGAAVDLSGSLGSDWSNSGTIAGATTGLVFSNSIFVNTGSISGGVTGVSLSNGARLENRAGGVISGGTTAIGPGLTTSNAAIINAGVINGNVNLAGQFQSATNFARYFAEIGGVLNGNLNLGFSDALITELINPGTGAFAGINGTVTANRSVLRYRVRADSSAVYNPVAGFETIGYELYNNANLVLTRNGLSTSTLGLSGTGSVDLDVNISTTTTPAIQSQSFLVPGGFGGTANKLAITSRGNLTLQRSDQNTFAGAAVALGSADTFTNLGTITFRELAPNVFSPLVAITGGASVTNAGSISLSGGIGVRDAAAFTNTGSLTQVAGGRTAQGVLNVASVTNSGTINVGGTAVELLFNGVLTNSGTIVSTGGTAVVAGSSARISNLAGGTITSAAGSPAIRTSGGQIINSGQITGDVNMGFSQFGTSFLNGTYISRGGTLTGNLLFGSGSDTYIETDGIRGVTGTIDGGAGFDLYGYARTFSGTVTLGELPGRNFEAWLVEAQGTGTTVTIGAGAPLTTSIFLGGDGAVINNASTSGQLAVRSNQDPFNTPAFPQLSSLTNNGDVAAINLFVRETLNTGTIGSVNLTTQSAVAISASGAASFTNTGTITNGGRVTTAQLFGEDLSSFNFTNSGSITNGGAAAFLSFLPDTANATATFANSGVINSSVANSIALGIQPTAPSSVTLALNNSGLIETLGQGGTGVYLTSGTRNPMTLSLTNSGAIRANANGNSVFSNRPFELIGQTVGLLVNGGHSPSSLITNTASGIIEATGTKAIALASVFHGLTLQNEGTITGAADNAPRAADAAPTFATAIHTIGDFADTIVNNGRITGSINLAGGTDVIVNNGAIDGNVFLGAGDDMFVQRASASLIGTVYAGTGTDALMLDVNGGGAINGDQFIDFESFTQTGSGDVTYSGLFRFDTIGISGGSATVLAGQSLRTNGPVTITGSGLGESVFNNGTIAGGLSLLGGADVVLNAGAIGGSVLLGDGDDSFVELAGSSVASGVDGGAGTDLYQVVLAGNRNGISARSGFEQLALTGSGVLDFTLDQNFDVVQLFGTSLNARLAGFGIGAVFGSDGAEALTLDGDIAFASLGGGSDVLSFNTAVAAGSYAGGAGSDALAFTATGPVLLTGSATGFEQISLGGNALVVAGTLGAAGDAMAFGAGAQQLLVAASGTVAGAIDLGDGNDVFRLDAGATQSGTIIGGAGTDLYSLGLNGDRTGIGARSGFEQLAIDGTGTLSLTLDQSFEAIFLAGTGLDLTVGGFSVNTLIGSDAAEVVRIDGGIGAVSLAGGNDLLALGTTNAAGQYLGGTGTDVLQFTGNGPVTLAGVADGFERIVLAGNALTVTGTLANDGAIDFGAGDQQITVGGSGILFGQVDLGDGNDLLRLAAGARLGGRLAGGSGVDTIALTLDGNRSGIGQLSGFERLALDGNGVLGLALTQSFDTISLAGVGLNLGLAGFTVGSVSGTGAVERVAADGDLGSVALGGGDDLLMLGATRAAGLYAGGTGLDSLVFTASAPVTLAGSVTGFELIGLTGGDLTVAGTLGSSGETILFADGNKALTIASGGRIAGAIDLGNGNDRLRLADGGVLAGTARGGAGSDTLVLAQASTRSISADQFTGFERLQTEGAGTLALASGTFGYDRVDASGAISIGRQATLLARDLVFGQGNNQLTIAGGFIGSIDGGAGTDRIEVSGGSATAPVMFGAISQIEAFTMNDGFATISNTASIGAVDLVRGRLIGLAGSTINASRITVASNAIFGSAGVVNGNLSVSGILSPGASPGTMTVNGNVALGSGSLSVFEITPTISDRLIVNGSLAIAPNATLQLLADQVIEPGRTIDLITTTGGVTGTFTNIIKPATLFGFVAVRGGSVQLLGQFLNDSSFSPQVQRSIDYVNAVLVSGQSSAALRAALPQLINTQGVASTTGFSLVSAEAYASAQHIGIDQGLSISDAGRGQAFATDRTTPGVFTFASGLTSFGNLEAQAARGTAAARTTGYGFLGGIGYGSQASAFGVFGGYIDSSQQIGQIGTRTEVDGFVAGVHGRLTRGSFGLKATIAYNGSNGVTRRPVPGGRADARFDLEGWVTDLSAHYTIAMGNDWTVQPSLGMTAIRSTRDGATEAGGTPFALAIASDRHNAVFVDAGLNFSGGVEPQSVVKPYLSLGVRYQVEGRDTAALAGFAASGQGLRLRLVSEGASRTPLRATAALGADVVLSPQLVLFGAASLEGGDADTRYGAQAGLRFAF